jgi:hypothetical protein
MKSARADQTRLRYVRCTEDSAQRQHNSARTAAQSFRAGAIYQRHWGAGMIKILIMVLLVGVMLPVMAAHFDEWSLKLRAGKNVPH